MLDLVVWLLDVAAAEAVPEVLMQLCSTHLGAVEMVHRNENGHVKGSIPRGQQEMLQLY